MYVFQRMTLLAFVLFVSVSCAKIDNSQASKDLDIAKALIAEAETNILINSANQQFSESVRLITRAIDSGELPDEYYSEALALRANAEQSLGMAEEAVADLNEAIARDPKNLGYYFRRSTVHQSLGNFDNAIADLTRVIEMSDSFPLAYRSRGAAFFALGDYDRAVEDLTLAIERDPKDVSLFSRRGDANFTLSQFNEAISDYRKSLELEAALQREIFENVNNDGYDPEEEALLLKIGRSFEELERSTEAVDIYEQILARNPTNREAQERLNLLER